MKISLKNLVIGVIVIVAMIIGWFVIRNLTKPAIKNLDSSGTSIVAFGDSLTYGVGSTPGHDFVTLLSNRIGIPIINLGHSGDTTADGLARIDEIFTHDPKIVIILLGGNDFLRRVPMTETFANLDKIVTNIQDHGSAVLILGIRGGLLTDAYNSEFESFARAHGVAFVPNVLDGLIGNDSFMSDSIHPNDAGYVKVADKVEPVLRDMLK